MTIVFENASVFDGVGSELLEGVSVAVEDNLIKEISDTPISSKDAISLTVVKPQLRICFRNLPAYCA